MKETAFEGLACISTKLEVARFPHSKEFKYLILESDPKPGYYSKGNFPENKEHVFDHHLYLVVKKPVACFHELVLRYFASLKAEPAIEAHIFPGQMTFQNENHQCIRLRTSDLNALYKIIKDLKANGIDFIKDRNVNPFVSFIQFKNYIQFKKIENGIYQNMTNPYIYFIEVPGFIKFDTFSRIIQQIKDNCDFYLLDASHAYLYYRDSVLDFVRIYSRHCDEKRLPEFKEKLEHEYSKVIKDIK
jgi:hypothetical protein